MKKYLLVLVALAFIAVGCSKTSQQTTLSNTSKGELKTYTNAKYGFNMQYPSTWFYEETAAATLKIDTVVWRNQGQEAFRILIRSSAPLPLQNSKASIIIDGKTYPVYADDVEDGFYHIQFTQKDKYYDITGEKSKSGVIDPTQQQIISSMKF